MRLSPQLLDLARRGAALELQNIDAEIAHLRAAFPGLPANGRAGSAHKAVAAPLPSRTPTGHRSEWSDIRRKRHGRMMRRYWRQKRLAATQL